MAVPARVFLHIGLHKTGTTFLQNLFRANRAGLADQGVDFPHGPGEPVTTFAVWDLQGRRPRGAKDPRIAGQWAALVERVNSSDMPAVLISEERLSISTLKQARNAIDPFRGSDVQVIVTARDLARIAVSSWQEDVKNDASHTWQRYLEALKDPARSAQNPARGFWMRQDLVKICEIWESALAPDRIHVVTVPSSGGDPDSLAKRFGSVVGFDATQLTEPPQWNNVMVGVAGIEVIRRVNERMGGRLNQIQYDFLVKRTLARMLAERTETVRFALPPEDMPWVAERADAWIDAIKERGYDVVGDLEDLRPRTREGARRPDEVSESELLEASLDALAMLSEDYATRWWARRHQKLDQVEEAQDLISRARAMVYKAQLNGARLADKSAVGAKAMGVVLRSRDRAVQKARKKQA